MMTTREIASVHIIDTPQGLVPPDIIIVYANKTSERLFNGVLVHAGLLLSFNSPLPQGYREMTEHAFELAEAQQAGVVRRILEKWPDDQQGWFGKALTAYGIELPKKPTLQS